MKNIELPNLDDKPLFRPTPRLPLPTFTHRLEDRQFIEIEHAFRASGGLVTGDELVRRLRRHADQPISTLARWIVDRRAVTVPWHGQTMIPMFQFELSNMTLRPAVTEAIHELKDVFDDWDLALWFARPNAWLLECAPVDLIAKDASAVIDAARADCFVAQG